VPFIHGLLVSFVSFVSGVPFIHGLRGRLLVLGPKLTKLTKLTKRGRRLVLPIGSTQRIALVVVGLVSFVSLKRTSSRLARARAAVVSTIASTFVRAAVSTIVRAAVSTSVRAAVSISLHLRVLVLAQIPHTPSLPLEHLHLRRLNETIRVYQRSSEALRGSQRPLEVIRGY